jgi:hypothetical protein
METKLIAYRKPLLDREVYFFVPGPNFIPSQMENISEYERIEIEYSRIPEYSLNNKWDDGSYSWSEFTSTEDNSIE